MEREISHRNRLYVIAAGLFMMLLLLIPRTVLADDTVGITITVKYGQTEARTILNMINEMRASSTDAWYWNSDNTTKTDLTGKLSPLQYDYDLEKIAMLRAAEAAVSYSHIRPNGQSCFTAGTYYGENLAAGYTSASAVNKGWREDSDNYDGQGHRRNMLDSSFNCIGIGHVYYQGTHYWAEAFGYKSSPDTTAVSANDQETVTSISVALSNISNLSVSLNASPFSLRVGQWEMVSIKSVKISVKDHWPSGSSITVLDPPTLHSADSSYASLSYDRLTGVSEGETHITASLYGFTANAGTVSVHDCDNHWDNGKITTAPTFTAMGVKTFTCSICRNTRTETVPKLKGVAKGSSYNDGKNKYKVTSVSTAAGTVAYVGSTIKASSVTIPNTVKINGLTFKVTEISAKAFKNNKILTTVKIGNNVTKIGNEAFSICTKLKSVTIGSKVSSIGTKAFYKCTALKSITLPASIKTIGKSAFEGCKNLASLTIKTVKLSSSTVGTNAFKNVKKNVTASVPKKQKKAYTKLLKARGFTGSAKIK